MNKLFKKLFAPIAIFAMALGVTVSFNNQSEIFGARATVEQAYYNTSFASSDGFTTDTNYQDTLTQGNTPYQWYFNPGTPSTTNAITSPSAHLRGYAANQTPSLETIFSVPDITKVTFTYKSDNNISVNLSYSTDNRATWSTPTNFATSTSATTVTYVINTLGLSGSTNLKWQMANAGTATGSKAELIIDDITIYHMVGEPAAVLSSISINGAPTKTTYFNGDAFDPTGITVTAHYSDSSTSDVTSSATFTPNPLVTGTTTVVARYSELGNEKTANIEGITVVAVVTTGISIATPGTQSFSLGQPFNTIGLSINASKNNSTSTVVSSGLVVTGIDTMILGNQTATVQYDGFTTTYTVSVTNQGASVGDSVAASDLFISEYIEGSSSNKVIEIYNGTGSTVNLTNYSVKLFANGVLESSPTNTQTFASQTLANGAVISLVNSSAAANFKKGTYLESNVANFNGDDAIALYKGTTIIDVIGVVGDDPGDEWTGTAANGTASTKDKTLVRTNSVTAPNTVFTWSEWNVFAIDTSSYLGTHDFVSSDVTILEQATAFANYVMTGEGLNANGECEAVLNVLQSEFGFMDVDAQLEFQTNPDVLFVNARARMSYLENWVAVPSGQIGRTATSNASRNNLIAVLTIGSVGLTSILAYYFVSKKKKFD